MEIYHIDDGDDDDDDGVRENLGWRGVGVNIYIIKLINKKLQ